MLRAVGQAGGRRRGKAPAAIALADFLQVGAPDVGGDAGYDFAVFANVDGYVWRRIGFVGDPPVDQVWTEAVDVAYDVGGA